MVAVEAVTDIAYYGAKGAVQAADITARQGTPRRSLEPILQLLTRTGILSGARGPRGGYRLGADAAQVTLGDIARVIASGRQSDDDPAPNTVARQVLAPLWWRLDNDITAQLDGISVASLVDSRVIEATE
jgi:Rrf2 family protein